MTGNKDFSDVKVLVVGDLMLDKYLWGEATRISPEAPVPVVRLKNVTYRPGGAANVAANISGLGAEPFLVGAVGDDAEGRLFPEILAASGIAADFLLTVARRQTTVKTRIMAHQQQIARLDQETHEPLAPAEEEEIWRRVLSRIAESDIIIVSDYGKGLLSENFLRRLITTVKKQHKLILIDPKGVDFEKYRGASILTPNKSEAARVCGFELENEREVWQAGEFLLAKLNLEAVLITLGEQGMTLFEKGRKSLSLSAFARQVYDVTGAGDTVIATLATFLAAGKTRQSAVKAANIAAGLVVEEAGTTRITLEKLKTRIKI